MQTIKLISVAKVSGSRVMHLSRVWMHCGLQSSERGNHWRPRPDDACLNRRRKEETKAESLSEWYVSSRNTLTAYRFLVAISTASRLILAAVSFAALSRLGLCAARRPLPVARLSPDSFFYYGIPRKCRWPYKLDEKLDEKREPRGGKNISTNSASKKKRTERKEISLCVRHSLTVDWKWNNVFNVSPRDKELSMFIPACICSCRIYGQLSET